MGYHDSWSTGASFKAHNDRIKRFASSRKTARESVRRLKQDFGLTFVQIATLAGMTQAEVKRLYYYH